MVLFDFGDRFVVGALDLQENISIESVRINKNLFMVFYFVKLKIIVFYL